MDTSEILAMASLQVYAFLFEVFCRIHIDNNRLTNATFECLMAIFKQAGSEEAAIEPLCEFIHTNWPAGARYKGIVTAPGETRRKTKREYAYIKNPEFNYDGTTPPRFEMYNAVNM